MPSLDIEKTIADARTYTDTPPRAQRCEVCGQTFNPQNLPEAEYHRAPQHGPLRDSPDIERA